MFAIRTLDTQAFIKSDMEGYPVAAYVNPVNATQFTSRAAAEYVRDWISNEFSHRNPLAGRSLEVVAI